MKQYTLQEIRTRVEELGVECNLQLIEQWLHEGELTNMKIGPFYQIEEQDLEDFVYHCQWQGTAYEKGIDDAEKIQRLQAEIRDLKTKITQLEEEKMKLEIQLGIEVF